MTTFNQRRVAERAIRSILSQPDPIGTEVIVVDRGSSDKTADHLQDVFREWVTERKLKIVESVRSLNLKPALDEAVQKAQGAWIALVDPNDHWLPNRLELLSQNLGRYDFLLESKESLSSDADPIRWFIQSEAPSRSSSVFKRTLFEKTSGFKSNPLGVKHPWMDLWLELIKNLIRSNQRERLLVSNQITAVTEHFEIPFAPGLVPQLEKTREWISLFWGLPRIPLRYWRDLKTRKPPR